MKQTFDEILADNKKRIIFFSPLFLAIVFTVLYSDGVFSAEPEDQIAKNESNHVIGDTTLNNSTVDKQNSYRRRLEPSNQSVQTDKFLSNFNKQQGDKDNNPDTVVITKEREPKQFNVRDDFSVKKRNYGYREEDYNAAPREDNYSRTFGQRETSTREDLRVYSSEPKTEPVQNIPPPTTDNRTVDFSTLGGDNTQKNAVQKGYYKAVIHDRTGYVISGQEVTIRLRENAVFMGHKVPVNTKFIGRASFSGERMNINIKRFMIAGGQIVNCNIEVLATDGHTGLFVEDHMNYDINQDVSDQAIDGSGTVIRTPIGELSTDILKKKKKEAKVPVYDGFKVLIREIR